MLNLAKLFAACKGFYNLARYYVILYPRRRLAVCFYTSVVEFNAQRTLDTLARLYAPKVTRSYAASVGQVVGLDCIEHEPVLCKDGCIESLLCYNCLSQQELDMYDWTLISNDGVYAYCIGTKAVCLRYALLHGLAGKTKLFYFPEPKHTK